MNNKSFTLLEIIITINLLTVGTISIVNIFSISIFADAEVENSTIAMYLAQEKMEEIRDATSYSAIDDFASAKTTLTGDFANFDREVTVSGTPKQVNVIVYWNVKGTDQNVNLVMLFANYDY